jgi:hypothetical protein
MFAARLSSPLTWLPILLTAVIGCGSDDASSGSGGGQGSDLEQDKSVLSGSETTYSEMGDAEEDTGYTIDDNGIAISGSLADGQDTFILNAGPYSTFHARIFIGGVSQGDTSKVRLRVDAVEDDGYSGLSGYPYFINAHMPNPNVDYYFRVSPEGTFAGDYVLEVIGNELAPQ